MGVIKLKRGLAALIFCGASLPCWVPIVQGGPQEASVQDYRAELLQQAEELKKKIEENPDNPRPLTELGKTYIRLGLWQEAASVHEQLVRLLPRSSGARLTLGWSYVNLGRYEDALRSHQEAIELNPDAPIARFSVGWDSFCLGRYEDAQKFYEQALALKPKYEAAHYELGRTYLAQGKSELVNRQIEILKRLDGELAELLSRELMRPPSAAPVRPSQNGEVSKPSPQTAGSGLRPTITYKEKAKYTRNAREMGIQGPLALSVVLRRDGSITDIRVIQGLPCGLIETGIEAVRKIKFQPGTKDGQPANVRMTLEYNFAMY